MRTEADPDKGKANPSQPLWAKKVEARFREFEPKLSWYKLSQATGIGQGRFSEWNHGRGGPDYRQIQMIADAIDVPVGYLTREDEGIISFGILSDQERMLVEAARVAGVGELLKIIFAAAVERSSTAKDDPTKKPDGPIEGKAVRSREQPGIKSSQPSPEEPGKRKQ